MSTLAFLIAHQSQQQAQQAPTQREGTCMCCHCGREISLKRFIENNGMCLMCAPCDPRAWKDGDDYRP